VSLLARCCLVFVLSIDGCEADDGAQDGGPATGQAEGDGAVEGDGGGDEPGDGGGDGDEGAVEPEPDPLASIAVGRNRLLELYLAHLRSRPTEAQSNGLIGRDLTDTCDLWTKLPPSARAVFLTITARLDGARLGADGSSMLEHVTGVYRIIGGDGATADDIGTCGGVEANRVILSMDVALHTALSAAHDNKGAEAPGAGFDVSDVPADGFWRDSHDPAGPHVPFDISVETQGGAPRAQGHYFVDPAAAEASEPLDRLDVRDVVDPYALEIDQDYDCFHGSNPLCEYTLYGPLCAPKPTRTGFDIFELGYGDAGLGWAPGGCQL
jgi:hypothetical protein